MRPCVAANGPCSRDSHRRIFMTTERDGDAGSPSPLPSALRRGRSVFGGRVVWRVDLVPSTECGVRSVRVIIERFWLPQDSRSGAAQIDIRARVLERTWSHRLATLLNWRTLTTSSCNILSLNPAFRMKPTDDATIGALFRRFTRCQKSTRTGCI